MFKKLALATALSMTLVSYQALADDAKIDAPKTAATAPKAGVSIAVINLRYIMSELPQAKAAAEEMKSQFGPRSQELKSIQEKGQKLESQLQTAKGEEVTKIQRQLAALKSDFDLKAQALQEDQQKKEREFEVTLGKLVQTAIDRIAKERGIDVVLRGESVVFATDAVDISKEVIERASKLKAVKKDAKKEAKAK